MFYRVVGVSSQIEHLECISTNLINEENEMNDKDERNKLYAVVYGILDAGLQAARTGEVQVVREHRADTFTEQRISEGLALIARFGWEITHRTEQGWATWTRLETEGLTENHRDKWYAEYQMLDRSDYSDTAREETWAMIVNADNPHAMTSHKPVKRTDIEAAVALVGQVTDQISFEITDVQMRVFEVSCPEDKRAATLAVDPSPRSVIHDEIFDYHREQPEEAESGNARRLRQHANRMAMNAGFTHELLHYGGPENKDLMAALDGNPTLVTRFILRSDWGEYPSQAEYAAHGTHESLCGRQHKPISWSLFPVVPQYVPLETEQIEAITADLRSIDGLKIYGARAEAIIAEMQRTGWLPIERAIELADRGIQAETLRAIVETHHRDSLVDKKPVDWVVVSAKDLSDILTWVRHEDTLVNGPLADLWNKLNNAANGPRLFE